jgi:pimeloyl-ACP methyl ester carboxylesterase
MYSPTFSATAGREKCTLVAHDFGGAIAWNFVMLHPEMLDSYVILGAPYSPSNLRVLTSNLFQVFMSWYAFTALLYFPQLSHQFELYKQLNLLKNETRPFSIHSVTLLC